MLENGFEELSKAMNQENNHKRKSLGRGLGALLGDDDISFEDVEQQVENAHHVESNKININQIDPSPYQPRK